MNYEFLSLGCGKQEKGSGLINMKSRAELINAKFQLSSKPDEGVLLRLEYPLV